MICWKKHLSLAGPKSREVSGSFIPIITIMNHHSLLFGPEPVLGIPFKGPSISIPRDLDSEADHRGMLEPVVLLSLFESLLATERDPLAWVGHIAIVRKANLVKGIDETTLTWLTLWPPCFEMLQDGMRMMWPRNHKSWVCQTGGGGMVEPFQKTCLAVCFFLKMCYLYSSALPKTHLWKSHGLFPGDFPFPCDFRC